MLPNLQLPLQLFKNENVELSNQRMNLRPRRRQPIINNTQQSRIPNANNWDLDVNSTAFQDVMAGRPIGSQAFIDKLQRDETALKEHSSLIRDWGNSWIVPFGKRQTQLDEEHDAEISIEEDYLDDADDDDEELIEDGYEEGDLDDEIEDVDQSAFQSSPPEEEVDLDDDIPDQEA